MSVEAQSHGRQADMSPDGEPVHVEREEFLRRIRKDFAISRIYYPGVGLDGQLKKPFGKQRVFPMDKDRGNSIRLQRPVHHFVQGRMEKSPYLDNAFDAVFIQDIHAYEEELEGILRTLRPNGIVIFSLDDCDGGDEDNLASLENHPQLVLVERPYYNETYRIFRKQETAVSTNGTTSIEENLEQKIINIIVTNLT